MKSLLIAAALVLLTTGCASQSQLIDSLAKDPASNCIVLSTPYGGVLVARATQGVKINLAGGSCTVDATGAAGSAPAK